MKRNIIKLAMSFALLSACTKQDKPVTKPTGPSPRHAQQEENQKAKAPITQDINQQAGATTFQLLEQEFSKAQQEVLSNMDLLQTTVVDSYSLLEVSTPPKQVPDNTSLSDYYDQHVRQEAKKMLEEKYATHELAFIKKIEPVRLEDIPYQFKAEDEDFRQKSQTLYLKITNAHPYHEQGRIARVLTLSALEVADELKAGLWPNNAEPNHLITDDVENKGLEELKKADEQTSKAKLEKLSQLSYQIAQALMLNIKPAFFEESSLPDKDVLLHLGQKIYKVLSGKHFFTGRSLTDQERVLYALRSSLMIDSEDRPLSEKLNNQETLKTVLILEHSRAKEKSSFIKEMDLTMIGRGGTLYCPACP